MTDRPLPALARSLPWPARLVVGILAVGLGLGLVTKPLSSLSALAIYLGITALVVGVGELARERRDRIGLVVGGGWVLLGLICLVLPDRALDSLPTVVAIALVVSGALRALRARAGSLDARIATGLLGLAEVVLGVVALAWGDLTLLVVAVIFGIRVVLVGADLVWDAVSRRDREAVADAPRDAGPLRRGARVVVAAIALMASLATLAISQKLSDGPEVDDFYAAPDDVPDQPGRLLRSEPFDRQVPDGAHGWRIVYTTTDESGDPTLASGLVVVPDGSTPDGGRPVVAWAHGTTGFARQCAPSLLEAPFSAGAFPAVFEEVVEEGWVVVATDYVGLGAEGEEHPYLVGKVSGQAVLDAVRAVRELDDAEASENTVVWGHSQGGGAALWTDQVQPDYAPDVPLAGTVAMAPASDVQGLVENLPNVTGGSVFASFMLKGYASAYDDIDLSDVVRSSAVPLVDRIADRCLSEPGVLASVLTALAIGDEPIFQGDPSEGALGARLAANVPLSPGPGPLLIAQGEDDSLVLPAVQAAYVEQLQANGHDVDYRTFPGLDHVPLVEEGSALLPQLVEWTAERFAGVS